MPDIHTTRTALPQELTQSFRKAYDFMVRHYPPRLDDDNGLKYWSEVAQDLIDMSTDADELTTSLCAACFGELEERYKAMRKGVF